MNEMLKRFVGVELSLSQQRGEFSLFALFLREDSQDKWDLAVAAPWIEVAPQESLTFIAKEVQAKFSQSELALLSRIVIIRENNPALPSLHREIVVRHGFVEASNRSFFGLPIKQAYIITSQQQPQRAAAVAVK